MQVRFVRSVVLVVAMGVAAAGCGKYSISNIRSAKAFQDANNLYKKNDYKGAAARYEDSIQFNPDLGFAYFFLGNSYDNLYKPPRRATPKTTPISPRRPATIERPSTSSRRRPIRKNSRFAAIPSSI
jgi:hypothetical protein